MRLSRLIPTVGLVLGVICSWNYAADSPPFKEVSLGYSGTKPAVGKYDSDEIDDHVTYDAAGNNGNPAGTWLFLRSVTGSNSATFGYAAAVAVTGDYDGDGTNDYGVYDAAGAPPTVPQGSWYVMQSSDGFTNFSFGYPNTVPSVGDFDGDGTDDYAVYDAAGNPPSVPQGSWYVKRTTAGFTNFSFGYAGTIPVIGDFDGDGTDDYGLYDKSGSAQGNWYFMRSTAGFLTFLWGSGGKTPAVADYNGDGTNDISFFNAGSTNRRYKIYLLPSKTPMNRNNFPDTSGGVAAPGQFDPDDKGNPTIYIAGTGKWYIDMTDYDADLDGLPNDWENEYGLDPEDATGDDGASGDPDSDDLTNMQEYELGTCPTNSNSDGDSASDSLEVQVGTDPLDADSFPVSISGVVTDESAQTGAVHIVAVTNSASWSTNWSSVISVPGAYSITNVPNLANYWVKAYRDHNTNGQYDATESMGVYTNVATYTTNDLTGINISMDGDADSDGLNDSVETDTGIFVSPSDTGSDPFVSNSDGDYGGDDGEEVDNRTDPNNDDTTLPIVTIVTPADGSGRVLLP